MIFNCSNDSLLFSVVVKTSQPKLFSVSCGFSFPNLKPSASFFHYTMERQSTNFKLINWNFWHQNQIIIYKEDNLLLVTLALTLVIGFSVIQVTKEKKSIFLTLPSRVSIDWEWRESERKGRKWRWKRNSFLSLSSNNNLCWPNIHKRM